MGVTSGAKTGGRTLSGRLAERRANRTHPGRAHRPTPVLKTEPATRPDAAPRTISLTHFNRRQSTTKGGLWEPSAPFMITRMIRQTLTCSPFGALIRLTAERWQHIVYRHPELRHSRMAVLMTVAAPDVVVQGNAEEMLAVRQTEPARWLVVAYKEDSAGDGFIITAFVTSRVTRILRRPRLWPPKT
jgi:hypothetical protein